MGSGASAPVQTALSEASEGDVKLFVSALPEEQRKRLREGLSVVGGSMKEVVVTGGNSGIGLALCKQLASEDGCYVYMGSRDVGRGTEALKKIVEEAPACEGKVEVVQIDIGSQDSVNAAVDTIKGKLGSKKLYALVNNAGTGLAHGVDAKAMVDTNLYGTKRMCDAFVPLLDDKIGRIVSVGSGAGPMYVSKLPDDEKKLYLNADSTWEELDAKMQKLLEDPEFKEFLPYGASKAAVATYTMILAKTHPNLLCSSITPGFIDTNIAKGMGAKKTPEEGTVSIRKCLFQQLSGNGFFWGSDGLRSPLDKGRDPGAPEYTGD